MGARGALAGVMVAVGAIAFGGGGDGTPERPVGTGEVVTETVGAAGTTIRIDGVSLEIPPGALGHFGTPLPGDPLGCGGADLVGGYLYVVGDNLMYKMVP